MRIAFLDTNIILDLILQRQDFAMAAQIFQKAFDGEIKIVTSALSMVNVAYVLRKAFKGDALYHKLRDLNEHIGVVAVSEVAYQKALESGAKDFEDAVQLFSAVEYGADCVVTRNSKDFLDNLIPVFDPSSFLNL